jgi:aryl-alcohol dehydrogenase-like predicted oxidoreductase
MNNSKILAKRRLGSTELAVTPIGLGVMQFAGDAGVFRFIFRDISQPEMDSVVAEALAGGINWFDTAEMYGNGRSEQGLARALRAAGKDDGDVIVATKWLPVLRTAGSIGRTIGERLRYLEGYTIDLYQIHNSYSFSSPEAEMDAMAELVQAGKIRAIGVSNFSAGQMHRAYAALQARGLTLATNQVQYSLLHRSIETDGVLNAAKELGVTIVAWSPLARGVLTGKFHRDPERLANTPLGRRMMLRRNLDRSRPIVEALEEIAEGYAATPTQVALNWVIQSQGDLVVAIPGASKPRHAAEAAGAMRFELSEQELSRLDQLSRGFR